MDLDRDSQLFANIEARVRRNAGSAGLLAGILIFFGFIMLGGEVEDALSIQGSTLLRYTLRLGGVAMIGVAVASSVGTLPALLVDAAVSLLVGLLIVLSVVFMVVGGRLGIAQFVVFVCGVMIMTLGLRTWGDYRGILRGLAGAAEMERDLQALRSRDDSLQVPDDPADGRTASPARKRSGQRPSTSGGVGQRGQERAPHRH